jgi:SAM-dependent methyltransferase
MTSEIVAESEARENAAAQLQQCVGELCKAIVTCETAELTRDEIAAILLPVRRAVAIDVHDVRTLPRNAFELVLTEGLFDSLSDSSAALLLERVYGVLAPGGTFTFTTLAADDPHRPLFTHLGAMPLIARTEEDLYQCCDRAGISRRNVTLRREERGRALRIEVQKLH